ncbi:hypothetical protein C6I21_14745 [Alkalicoccus urumqiensis]|uniref:SelT/SelW/SelH family protein n=1 Tax=Alkalicoccus urumqiensis TaxID=1548213 RepID=A0A2P6MDW8_ALKUR|nr:hypothetical protein C6I21_14745 [Alkalicoccus urumqiensis]
MFESFRHDIHTLELIPGSGGVFDIQVDESLVYSKKESGTFPDHTELISRIRNKGG